MTFRELVKSNLGTHNVGFTGHRIRETGAYPECRFLVIRRNDSAAGLFSYVATMMAWFDYAERQGMIPVVDMAHYRNIYSGWFGFLVTHVNAWDLFFGQPGGYTPSDAFAARDVTVVDGLSPEAKSIRDVVGSERTLNRYRELARKYLKVKDGLSHSLNRAQMDLIASEPVIGVLARGTDFASLHPKGHAVQPTADELIEAVNRYSASGHDKEPIFLVTEDAAIRDRFRSVYGKRLMEADQSQVVYSGGLLAVNYSRFWGDRKRGADYLRAVLLLARCDSLFGGINNGTFGAMVLSKGFRHVELLDTGDYKR